MEHYVLDILPSLKEGEDVKQSQPDFRIREKSPVTAQNFQGFDVEGKWKIFCGGKVEDAGRTKGLGWGESGRSPGRKRPIALSLPGRSEV
jgi:hypothetical protein